MGKRDAQPEGGATATGGPSSPGGGPSVPGSGPSTPAAGAPSPGGGPSTPGGSPAASAAGPSPAAGGSQQSILVADDEDSSRRLVKAILEGAGYAVTIATGGEEA